MEIGLRIFFSYSVLFVALFAFNLYRYLHRGGIFSLIVTILSALFFAAWAFAYFFYFRKKN
jgi:hypothetical protein